MVARFMERTVSTVRDRGAMYKALDQLVLFYGSNFWMLMGEMLTVMEGFHHRAAQRIMGLTEKCGAGGDWEYPPVME